MLTQNKSDFLKKQVQQVRLSVLDMLTKAKSSHLGSAFSIIEILTIFYNYFINIDLIKNKNKNRDYFILSKGHAVSALYATLASVGVISSESLNDYCTDGSKLGGHPTKDFVFGIEASTGSLGHCLPLGVGVAIAFKKDKIKNKVYVLLGDGECQEGSVLEAIQLAVRLKLNNLVVIVDNNKLQGFDKTEEISTGCLEKKFIAFGCNTFQVNGHDFCELFKTFDSTQKTDYLDVIIADTIKGKGISFTENKLEWHYKSATKDEYSFAKKEILGL